MTIRTINKVSFRYISKTEQVVTINKQRSKLVSYDIASAIFELCKMRTLNAINNALFNKSINDILQLD